MYKQSFAISNSLLFFIVFKTANAVKNLECNCIIEISVSLCLKAFSSTHLKRVLSVLVVLRVGLKVIDVNVGQTRNEQLQFLLIEDGDKVFGDDVIEPLEEAVYLRLDGLPHLHVAGSLDVLSLIGLRHSDVPPVGDQVFRDGVAKLFHLYQQSNAGFRVHEWDRKEQIIV